jgi:hypothetical protein
MPSLGGVIEIVVPRWDVGQQMTPATIQPLARLRMGLKTGERFARSNVRPVVTSPPTALPSTAMGGKRKAGSSMSLWRSNDEEAWTKLGDAVVGRIEDGRLPPCQPLVRQLPGRNR